MSGSAAAGMEDPEAAADRYLVVGNPIGHSRSPEIHAAFARQTGQSLCYRALLVGLDEFEQTLDRLRAEGVRGTNVTAPFKQRANAYVTRRSGRAARADAANTLMFAGDDCYGDNTDGLGLVRDLTVNNGIDLAGRRLLVLGAGGAARGVMAPLLAQRPAALTVANRTATRAEALAAQMADLGPVDACSPAALAGRRFDVLINATSAALSGGALALPDGLLAPGGSGYDMNYAAAPTAFMHWCREQGAVRVCDGIGMLVEQAAESFLLWRGVRPETRVMIDSMRGAQREC